MVNYNWLKLPSIAGNRRRNGTYRECGNNSGNLHRWFRNFSHFILLETTEEEGKRRAFFRWQDQYRDHSKDLGDALYEWWKGQKLSYCEYKDGRYEPLSLNFEVFSAGTLWAHDFNNSFRQHKRCQS